VIGKLNRGAEEGDNGVSLELVDGAVFIKHYVAHGGKIIVKQSNKLFRAELFRNGGKIFNIRKNRRHVALGSSKLEP